LAGAFPRSGGPSPKSGRQRAILRGVCYSKTAFYRLPGYTLAILQQQVSSDTSWWLGVAQLTT
jgi:hypothetical protein